MEEAAAAPAPKSEIAWSFWGKRLHSLSGAVPLGAFLCEHLLTNSMMAKGPRAFNEAAWKIESLPYLLFLEIFLIFIPLTFHAGYGIYLAVNSRFSLGAHPYPRNLLYTLQRVTGLIAFFFIVYHLATTRFAMNPSPTTDFYQWMADRLYYPATKGIYVIGLSSVVFHFANGLNTALMTWGITVSRRSQTWAGFACAGIGFVLLTWGLMAIFSIQG